MAVKYRFDCTKKCTVDPIFHANWRERHDLTVKHLSTQNCTVDPIFHANWKERPDFTAGHLSTQKMHCWPCLSRKLEGAARFYGRVSKYPKCTVEPVFHGDWNERPDFTANHLSTQITLHCWANLSWKLEGTARFYGKASKFPKLHCWPYLSCKVEGTARFYGRASKYPKMHCWPYLSCKVERMARFYGRASKYPKMHCWPCLSWKLEGTARFYGKASN